MVLLINNTKLLYNSVVHVELQTEGECFTEGVVHGELYTEGVYFCNSVVHGELYTEGEYFTIVQFTVNCIQKENTLQQCSSR